MIKSLALAAAALAGVAQAINFTTTFDGKTLAKNSIVELDWSTVDTDPDTLSIYLVNFVQWPPLTYSLAEDVQTQDGNVAVRIPCDVDSTSGFQFNAINGTNTYVIYAQTDTFSIKGNCTEKPDSDDDHETVNYKNKPTKICRPKRKDIFNKHDTVWVVKHGEHDVRTCDKTATETVTAHETCTVTKTVGETTKTVTVVGGTVCPDERPKPHHSSKAAPPKTTGSAVPPYPVPTPPKNVTSVKPSAVFTSGADNVKSTVVFVAGLAIVAALVM